MKLYVQINDETIRRAASIVMKHYADEEFLRRIREVDNFNHTTFSPVQCAAVLPKHMQNLSVRIVPYMTFNPFSNVIGHAKSDMIFVNTRKLHLPLMDRVQNIYHECTHLIGFSHKGNKPNAYNMKTVPYKAASIFSQYAKEIYG